MSRHVAMRTPIAVQPASNIDSALHTGFAAESMVHVGAPSHLCGKPHYGGVATAIPTDISLSLLKGQLADVPHNVHAKTIQLDEGSCRVTAYVSEAAHEGRITVYLRKRESDILGKMRRRDVRFVMDLPEWMCDYILHSVINVDQLSELRVSIRELGTAVEIDALNVEDFNSFVIQAREVVKVEHVDGEKGLEKAVAGEPASFTLTTCDRHDRPIAPFSLPADQQLEPIQVCAESTHSSVKSTQFGLQRQLLRRCAEHSRYGWLSLVAPKLKFQRRTSSVGSSACERSVDCEVVLACQRCVALLPTVRESVRGGAAST